MRYKWLKIIFSIVLLTLTLTVKPEELFSNACKAKCKDTDMIYDASTIASSALSVDLALILAIMKIESSFLIKARNGNSVGLMQVNLKYHKHKFKGKDPYGIYDNIFIGTSIFKDCLDKHKQNVNKALRCYNGSHNSNVYPEKIFKAVKTVKPFLNS